MSIISNFPQGGGGGADIPTGIVAMWSGAANAIPTGWALCDGANGTPDLRGRFVLGAGGTYAVGAAGGEENHTLTVAEMPRHTHMGLYSNKSNTGSNLYSNGSVGGQTESTASGSSQPHNNMPPYYALCYIMKL